jgi:hypothetical protein
MIIRHNTKWRVGPGEFKTQGDKETLSHAWLLKRILFNHYHFLNAALFPYPSVHITDNFYPKKTQKRIQQSTTEETVVYYLKQHKTTPPGNQPLRQGNERI